MPTASGRSFLLLLVTSFALSCTPGRDEDVGVGRSLLTDAERRDRAALIRDVARGRGLTQGWLLAGVADAETQMSHCWSELTWACMGPSHPDCGGPVVAGAGDGPCDIMQGGLGMFQFDAGTYDETIAREGERVLSLRGNVDAAVDFVIGMVIRSEFIDGVDTDAQAIEWMNGVRVDNEYLEPWAMTVTRYYNGCRTTSSCWPERLPRYRSHAVDVYAEMGAAFWDQDIDYAARYVEQSFPLAAEGLVLPPGAEMPGYIELSNEGGATWTPGSTFLGTTEPRDSASPLAASDWVSEARPATVEVATAPDEVGRFAFSVRAPDEAGDYSQFFNLVEEGEAWFSDQGGPPDAQLEVRVIVDPAAELPPGARFVGDEMPMPDGGVIGRMPGDGGGGCAVGEGGGTRAWWLAVLVLLAMRRQRSRRIR